MFEPPFVNPKDRDELLRLHDAEEFSLFPPKNRNVGMIYEFCIRKDLNVL